MLPKPEPKSKASPRITNIGANVPPLRRQYGDKIKATHDEKAVLGALLIDGDLYYSLSDILSPGDFYDGFHALIWFAAGKLAVQNPPVSIELNNLANAVVSEPLCPHKDFAECKKILGEMMAAPAKMENVREYALRVKDAALRLRGLDLAQEVVALTQRRDITRDEYVAGVHEIAARYTEYDDMRPTDAKSIAGDLAESFIKAREDQKSGIVRESFFPTGFTLLDGKNFLDGGFFNQMVTVLVGGAGDGKTRWLLSTMFNAMPKLSSDGGEVLLFSQEMNREQIGTVFLAMQSGISAKRLIKKEIRDEEWDWLFHSLSVISTWKYHVIDKWRQMTPLQFKTRVLAYQREHDIRAVYLDGLWRMKPDLKPGQRAPEADYVRYPMITEPLSEFVGTLNLPVVIAHQYTRSEIKEYRGMSEVQPQLDWIAGSQAIERDFQTIIGMWRPMIGDTQFHLLKDRFGLERGVVQTVKFDPNVERYVDDDNIEFPMP